MEIYVGADYRGYELKKKVIEWLKKNNYDATDIGCYDTEENDFNDSAVTVARAVRRNHGAFGILICDSAHGMTMQANRFKGVRAAHCFNPESAKLAREHDDANIVCLSAHLMKEPEAEEIIKTFLTTKFAANERRMRRINRLDEREDYD